MKTVMKNLSIVLAIMFIAAACGKYEEGPSFSLASKKSRIVNVWCLDALYENGVEQTLTPDDKDDYIEFKKDGSAVLTWVVGTQSVDIKGAWELSSDNSKLMVIIKDNNGNNVDTTNFTILRLKSNELWMEEVDGNYKDEYHYITKK